MGKGGMIFKNLCISQPNDAYEHSTISGVCSARKKEGNVDQMALVNM